MSPIKVRSVSVDEAAPIFNWMSDYAFMPTPPIRDEEKFRERLQHTEGFNNYMVLYEDDIPASCGAAGPMIQNVRGSLVNSAGVFMVATHPNYRRKRYSYTLLKELVKKMYADRFGFSTLYPFRESFYERLGYANWPTAQIAEINIRSLTPLLKYPFEAELEMLEFTEHPELYYEFIQKYQKQVHGVASFVKHIPPDPERHKSWMLVSRDKGEVDGMMLYKTRGEEPTQFTMDIRRFYPLSATARYQFLQWIARHIDQTDVVKIALPPFEQPSAWYRDLNLKLSVESIAPMGRVIDIEQLNGLPVGEGNFTARIVDPICPWNEGIWTFSDQNGKLQVTRAQQTDSWLGIQGLSALVFGGIPPENFAFHEWGELPVRTLQAMTRLFPPMIPYLHEYF